MTTLIVPLVLSMATPLTAQDTAVDAAQGMFPPAKEMRAYSKLIGDWTGGGKLVMAPGQDATEWTATARYEPILDGHSVQESTIVSVEGMGPMHFTTWYAFDAERKQHRSMGVSSMGPGHSTEVHWTDANTMVTASMMEVDGEIVADRTVFSIGDDAWLVKMYRAIGAGPEFIHVTGEFHRAPDADAATAEAGAQAPEKPVGELARLQPLVGNWSLTGSMSPMPGMPHMELTGTETITVGPGGSSLLHHIVGAAGGGPRYEAWAGSYYDPATGGYQLVMIDNMGGIDTSIGRFAAKDVLVYVGDRTLMGVPNLTRTMLTMKDGGISTVTTDAMYGTADANRIFDAKYTRAR